MLGESSGVKHPVGLRSPKMQTSTACCGWELSVGIAVFVALSKQRSVKAVASSILPGCDPLRMRVSTACYGWEPQLESRCLSRYPNSDR
ncbi:hypothetical protein [Synechococcus sp. PCC 7336]|uniref:hypothetical protein n=1 Tax=Synechococcus sp. PCC 7336 TaxID=195250 RepID=UPI00034A27D0|nr:hypothetical protein [Synechococcus sp. PCC 7336]